MRALAMVSILLGFSHCAHAIEPDDSRFGRWRTSQGGEDGGFGDLTLDVIACERGFCAITVENETCKSLFAEPYFVSSEVRVSGANSSQLISIQFPGNKIYVAELRAHITEPVRRERLKESGSSRGLWIYGVEEKSLREEGGRPWRLFSRRSYPVSAHFDYIGPARCDRPVS